MSLGHTKDEKFILKLYEIVTKANDMDLAVSRYEIGNALGLQKRGVDTTCVLLGQANFIKKAGDVDIRLTKQGEQLALRLLEE
jgi:hypothetical protein